MVNAKTVQYQKVFLTEGNKYNPKIDNENGFVEIRPVSKRFTHHDTSGLFLNHFPLTNSYSTSSNLQGHGTYRSHSFVANKVGPMSSAFRHRKRVIESKPPLEDLKRVYNEPPRVRQSPALSNALQNALWKEKTSYHSTKLKNDRHIKAQEWKDTSDRLMDAWSYVSSDTTSPANMIYGQRTPAWTFTTQSVKIPMTNAKPLMQESVQHEPTVVRTRVPTSKSKMISYDESHTISSSRQYNNFNRTTRREQGIYDTRQPSTTSKPPINLELTPNTGSHEDGGYVIGPHKLRESVYHQPSQLHTRTLLPHSWKTVEHGRPNISITAPDSNIADYMQLNNIHEPRGYVTPDTQLEYNHSTRESEHKTVRKYNDVTGTNTSVKEPMSQLSDTVKDETSTVVNGFVDPSTTHKDVVPLTSLTSKQPLTGDKHPIVKGEYLFSENINKRTQIVNFKTDVPMFIPSKNTTPLPSSEYHLETNAFSTDQFLTDKEETTERNLLSYKSTADTLQNAISQSTSTYTMLNTEDIMSTVKSPNNRTKIEKYDTTVLRTSTRPLTTTTPMSIKEPLTPKRLPTKMKVYDITEILQGKPKSSVKFEKEKTRGVRKKTPMKLYDIKGNLQGKSNDNRQSDRQKTKAPMKEYNKKNVLPEKTSSYLRNTTSIEGYNATDSISSYTSVIHPPMKGTFVESHKKQDNRLIKTTKVEKSISKTKTYVGKHLKKDLLKSDRQPNVSSQASGKTIMHPVEDLSLLARLKNQERYFESDKYHVKPLTIKRKVVKEDPYGKRAKQVEEQISRAELNEINAHDSDMKNFEWLSEQQNRQTQNKISNDYGFMDTSNMTDDKRIFGNRENKNTVPDQHLTMHNNSDTHYLTRAISVIKGLLDKIQAKPIMKAIPRPNRQKYLLIPLGNLTFTEIKKKLLTHQLYMQEFQNNRWSENSLVNHVKADTERPLVLEHRPKQ
ncbi:uncharacterized protein LOC132556430 [Ylistrum balloti]|uniref:uncharacterized protein LOC132556430 n=1 Tax=Ylistrum balloti TaxID=509963 RepID=UPI002905B773|nr:uncharacterized protein LOC132556430 [Ylistrum balloti]